MLLSRRLLWCVGLSLSLTLSLIALSTATVSSTSSSESVQWVDAILLEESTKPSLASNSESSMVHNGEVAPEATVGTLGQATADDVNNAATELTPPIAPNPSDFNRQAQYAHPFFPDEHWRRSVYGLRRRRVPYGRYKDQYGSINPYRNPNNDRTVPEDMVQPRNRLDVAMNPKLTDFGKESHMKFGSKQEPPRGGFSSVKLHEERWHLAQPMYQQNWMQTYPYNSGNYNPFRNHLLPVDYKVPEHLDFSDFSLAAAYPAALGGIVYGSPSMIYGTTGYPFTSPSQPHGSASGVPYGPSVMGQSLLNKFHELAQAGGEVNNLASNAVKRPTTVAPAKKEGETTEEKKEE